LALSALEDATREPLASDVAGVLGASADLWWDLVARIHESHAPVEERWHFSGAKFGWNLRLVRKDRVIMYLSPQCGGFLVGLVLGEKAVEAARHLELPVHVTALMEAAPRYSEGRGFRVPVESTEDVHAVVALAGVKMTR
jgi:hypothetical protein